MQDQLSTSSIFTLRMPQKQGIWAVLTEEANDYCREAARYARAGHDIFRCETGFTHNLWIHEQNVGEREEGCDTGTNLGRDLRHGEGGLDQRFWVCEITLVPNSSATSQLQIRFHREACRTPFCTATRPIGTRKDAVAVLQPFRGCGANTKDNGASGEKVRGVADSSLAGPRCRQGKG
jgi:hypothetical protein